MSEFEISKSMVSKFEKECRKFDISTFYAFDIFDFDFFNF